MNLSRGIICVVAAAMIFTISHAQTAKPSATTKPAHPFRDHVKVEVTADFYIIKSDGIPDHETGQFPGPRNPNSIKKQNYSFKIPRNPQPARTASKIPMGPIGVAINGVPFYNPYNAEGMDAAKNEAFDSCCGHPDFTGRYHYHIYPKCVKTPFKKDDGSKHSDLLGFAFDGYGIYGPLGENGKPPTDLDECNGHTDATRGYHYHVTDKFPYILGGYHGVVEISNFDHPRAPRDTTGPGVMTAPADDPSPDNRRNRRGPGPGGPGGRPPRGQGGPPPPPQD